MRMFKHIKAVPLLIQQAKDAKDAKDAAASVRSSKHRAKRHADGRAFSSSAAASVSASLAASSSAAAAGGGGGGRASVSVSERVSGTERRVASSSGGTDARSSHHSSSHLTAKERDLTAKERARLGSRGGEKRADTMSGDAMSTRTSVAQSRACVAPSVPSVAEDLAVAPLKDDTAQTKAVGSRVAVTHTCVAPSLPSLPCVPPSVETCLPSEAASVETAGAPVTAVVQGKRSASGERARGGEKEAGGGRSGVSATLTWGPEEMRRRSGTSQKSVVDLVCEASGDEAHKTLAHETLALRERERDISMDSKQLRSHSLVNSYYIAIYYMYVYVAMYTYMDMSVCMHVCMYVCMYLSIYMMDFTQMRSPILVNSHYV